MQNNFLMDFESIEKANVIAFGVPLGRNAEKILESLRKTSHFVEWFDLDRKKNLLEAVKLVDLGNLTLKNGNEISEKVREIRKMGKIPLILGKSHLLTFYALRGFDEKVKLIDFDAHCDIKDSYLDEKVRESIEPLKLKAEKYNCTTWVRRFCELGRSEDVMLLGVRSCDEDDLKFMEENKISYFTSNQIKENLDEARKKLEEFVKDSKVYVSLDIDFFDPSIAPSVDHPEPNGLSFLHFSKLVEVLKGRIIGFDLVEIAWGEKKLMEITEFLAVRSAMEVLSLLF